MTICVDPDWWQTLFDETYLTTDARSVCNEELTRREVDVFCKLIPLRIEHSILDLCGGHGRHTMELCRRGYGHCTVLDFSEPLLKIGAQCAQKHNYQVNFIQADARETRLKSERFDHVLILGNSLGYVPDQVSDQRILREAYRLLKSQGWLLVDVTDGQAVKAHFTPNAWHEINSDVVVCRHREICNNIVYAREMVLNKQCGLIRDKTYCIRMYEPQTVGPLIENSGFENVTVHTRFSPQQCQGDVGFMNHRMITTAQKP
ncbi:MAG: class I SAM-dependent methyltransferase [Desulfobacterales bacterium]|nr:class I SAM-dependent methyltransferase [Desulfobacterales bacterium]